MNAAEKIINLMRDQCKHEIGKGLQLATMKDSETIILGDIELDRDCYLKTVGLSLQAGDCVVIYQMNISTFLLLAKVV